MALLRGLAAALPLALAGALPTCPGTTTADEVLAQTDLAGKIAVVTGGDNGLGFATSLALAKRGATIVIGNRNVTKGEEAAQNITKQTGAQVAVLALDLSSLSSVRHFAGDFSKRFGDRLDILVNNAGVTSPSKLAEDGFEFVFQVDYLGHFLLTELLLPALRSAAPSRIVNLGSGEHATACQTAGWAEDCFKDWTYLPPPVVPKKNVTVHEGNRTWVMNSSTYGVAKFALIQHAAVLARRERLSGVRAFSLTPGFTHTSMTSGFDPSSPEIKFICQNQEHPDPSLPANPCPFSSEQGAAVVTMLAAGLRDEGNGEYHSRVFACETRPVVMQGFTEAMQDELYMKSLSWVGFSGSDVVVQI